MKPTRLIFALCLLPTVSLASTLLGNPSLGVVLIDDAEVYVDRVVAVDCATSTQQTHTVGETLEQWDQESLTLDVDTDYCELNVWVRWTPQATLEEVPVSGFDVLTTQASAQAVTIELEESSETATLVQ